MGLLNYKAFLNEFSLHEAEMKAEEWNTTRAGKEGKYKKQFLEFLNDPNKELKIDPKFANKYSFSSFKVSEIENITELKEFIESGADVFDNSDVKIKVNATEVKLVNLQKTNIFSTSAITTTPTEVKEGMVTYFYYNQDLDFWNDLSVSEQAINNIHKDALDSKALAGIKDFIANVTDDKKTADLISEWQSSAAILKPFADAGFQITRSRLFNEIRAKGKTLSRMSAEDNWCPGDIYIYNPNALAGIVDTLNTANLIGELNLLFNDNFEPISDNSPIGSIWAISLKQAESRVGKAKEWVSATAPKDTVYNLTKEEQVECKKDPNWGRQEIAKYQDMIKNFVKSSDIMIKYNPGDVSKISDNSVQDKLAAIKLTYHLITIPRSNAKDLDSNLLSVLKFGLKLSDPAVNPPYFKVKGSIKGNASYNLYQGGDTLSLLIKGLDSPETMVSIVDRSSAKQILLYYYANKKDIAYEYELKVGTAGNVQATVEFTDEKAIGDIKQDPDGVTAAVIAKFNSRN